MVAMRSRTLGERIRELRGATDMSLRELSAKLKGASAAFLSDIELGRRYPSEKTLAQLADVLGTTLEDLQQYDTRPPVEAMRRRAAEDPAVGMAFRKIAEMPSKDLLEIAKKIREEEKGKGK